MMASGIRVSANEVAALEKIKKLYSKTDSFKNPGFFEDINVANIVFAGVEFFTTLQVLVELLKEHGIILSPESLQAAVEKSEKFLAPRVKRFKHPIEDRGSRLLAEGLVED